MSIVNDLAGGEKPILVHSVPTALASPTAGIRPHSRAFFISAIITFRRARLIRVW
jgi:hypothetical protein